MTKPKYCNYKPGNYHGQKKGGHEKLVVIGFTGFGCISRNGVTLKCSRCGREFKMIEEVQLEKMYNRVTRKVKGIANELSLIHAELENRRIERNAVIAKPGQRQQT